MNDIDILKELLTAAKESNQYAGNKYYKAISNLISENKELKEEKERIKELKNIMEEIFEKYEEKIKREYEDLRSKAYTVSLQDNYAITLRDSFNENEGKRIAMVQLKNEIYEKYKEEL